MSNIPVRVNQILKLTVDRFGREGDLIFLYKKFIIIVKPEERFGIGLNEFMKIRVTKVLPKFALGVFVK